MKKIVHIFLCVTLTTSLMADHGSPSIRPSEEAGDLADTAPRGEEILPKESQEQMEDDLIESADQQIEEPFVASRFASERMGDHPFLVFFVTVLFFAGGMVAVNANRGARAS